MAKQIDRSQHQTGSVLLKRSISASILAGLGTLGASLAAYAHHPFGGQTPATALEGLLSGLGHPVIGIDHLVFVVAIGLVAALLRKGVWVPIAFVGTAVLGTGIHLQGWDLPSLEFFISASVLVFGGLLASKQIPSLGLTTGLSALAGVFHGYAYGEAIVGAEITPLTSYLLGFSVMQLAIATLAYGCGRTLNTPTLDNTGLPIRFAGFAIAGMGLAFVSSVLLG